MRTLGVIDLVHSSRDDSGWRVLRMATAHVAGRLTTPAGFAFSEVAESGQSSELRVVIVPPGERPADTPAQGTAARAERLIPTATLRPEDFGRRASSVKSGLNLRIVGNEARVELDPQGWDLVSAPVLLAIAQCWRFREVDRLLDELSAWARRSPERKWRPILPSDWKETDAQLKTFQKLLLDLPSIEGPLTDPGGYFASKGAARIYRQLARGLGLLRWRALIDERIEVAEAVLGHLAEERRHASSITASLILEVLILIVLLTDLGLNIAQMFFVE
jgi:hypothetical protein